MRENSMVKERGITIGHIGGGHAEVARLLLQHHIHKQNLDLMQAHQIEKADLPTLAPFSSDPLSAFKLYNYHGTATFPDTYYNGNRGSRRSLAKKAAARKARKKARNHRKSGR